jgi:guanylate kinase
VIEFQLSRSGILFVVSAPSGGGKSTILRRLLEVDRTISYSVSATTRAPRRNEEDGKDYYFKSVAEFEGMIAGNAFLEHAKVHGNYYGTPKAEVDRQLRMKQDVVLDIDVQGSLALKRARPSTVLIFILPPSIATLEKRLRSRGLDDDEVVRLRLNNAREEIRHAPRYDYALVNEDLDLTILRVQQIIEGERWRTHRLKVNDALGEVKFLPASAV